MKIDEFSPEDEGITNAPAQINKVPQMMKRHQPTKRTMPPLDFEKIMLVGYNENLYDYEE